MFGDSNENNLYVESLRSLDIIILWMEFTIFFVEPQLTQLELF
jgi:hypothetical protein